MAESKGWFQIDSFTNRSRGISDLDVRFGSGRVAEIGEYARQRGYRRAMIVTGPNVGSNEEVIGPLRESLGDILAGEYLEVSRGKQVTAVFDAVERMKELDADLVIGVGGGGSLDTARQMSTFAGDGRSAEQLKDAVRAGQPVEFAPGSGVGSVMLVPSTLAGADLSTGGSIEILAPDESPDGRPKRINPQAVAPVAVFYDPRVYASSPYSVLIGSAMNGFNKGVETLYSPHASPYSDALTTHGLGLVGKGLIALSDDPVPALEDAVAGMILLQLERRISVLHAFGHAIARNSTVQQGIGHAIMTPHVLRFLLTHFDLRRDVLAQALRSAGAVGAGSSTDADAIVEGVTAIRDALGLPARLSDVGIAETLDFRACAEHVCADSLMKEAPVDRDLTVDEVEEIFEQAA